MRRSGRSSCMARWSRSTRAYRAAGVALPPTQLVTEMDKAALQRALVVAPPSVQGSPWLRRFGDYSDAFASGWMQLRGTRRRRGVDRGFVLSATMPTGRACSAPSRATGAERVIVTHGYEAVMVRWLQRAGPAGRGLRDRLRRRPQLGRGGRPGADSPVPAGRIRPRRARPNAAPVSRPTWPAGPIRRPAPIDFRHWRPRVNLFPSCRRSAAALWLPAPRGGGGGGGVGEGGGAGRERAGCARPGHPGPSSQPSTPAAAPGCSAPADAAPRHRPGRVRPRLRSHARRPPPPETAATLHSVRRCGTGAGSPSCCWPRRCGRCARATARRARCAGSRPCSRWRRCCSCRRASSSRR